MDTTTNKPQRIRSPLPEEISTVYSEETELHWRRIITAILVVLGVLTLVGWILMNSISAQKAAEVISSIPASEKAKVDKDEVSKAATEVKPRIQPLEEAIPEVPAVNETLTEVPLEKPQSAVPIKLGETEPLYVNVWGAPALAEIPLVQTTVPLATARFLATPDLNDAAQITRNPAFVSTLLLTSQLKDKNPTDQLDARITINGKELVKVYAYSELTNLKGERVFHDWYRGEKRVARVPVGVYLDEMRASSSKYIDQNMAGDWHMEITRANGEQLGRLDFRVESES